MDRVRSELDAVYAYKRGLLGGNVGVAVLDSGIAWRHPDLKGRVAYAAAFGQKNSARDECGHGTHISGIIGGTGLMSGGKYQGIAPGCYFVSVKVLDDQGRGRAMDVVEALSWIGDYGKKYGVRIVNISMGGIMEKKEAESLLKAVDDLWKKGFIICAAAGNEGPREKSITIPGTSRTIITVGSSDDEMPVQMEGKKMRNYSGRGPTEECVCKPDVVAPGYRIVSCRSDWREKGVYCVKSGTSMATPVVCGALALLLSREPLLTNKEVKLRLMKSCIDQGWEKNRQGCGKIWIPGLLNSRDEEEL